MRNILLALIFFMSSSLMASAVLPSNIYEFNYFSEGKLKIYAGTKNTIRLYNIPSDIDLIQVGTSHSRELTPSRTLGRRHISISSSVGLGYVDFGFEIPISDQHPLAVPVDADSQKVELSRIRVVLFKSYGDGVEKVETRYIDVEVLRCPSEGQEVCALVKTQCSSRDRNCVEKQVLKTYPNQCLMLRDRAEFLLEGSCPVQESQ